MRKQSLLQAHTHALLKKSYFNDENNPLTLYLRSCQGKILLIYTVFLLFIGWWLCWRRWTFSLQKRKNKYFIISFFKQLFSLLLSQLLEIKQNNVQNSPERPNSWFSISLISEQMENLALTHTLQLVCSQLFDVYGRDYKYLFNNLDHSEKYQH